MRKILIFFIILLLFANFLDYEPLKLIFEDLKELLTPLFTLLGFITILFAYIFFTKE